VEILVKRGSHVNELTKFRYDVVLHVGGAPPVLDGATSWSWDESLGVDAVAKRLRAERPEAVHLAGVPNGRLEHDLRTRALVSTLDPSTPAATLLAQASAETEAPDPEALARAAEGAGYRVELHEAHTAGAGTYDAVLVRAGRGRAPGKQRRLLLPPAPAAARRLKPWNHYTNSPSRGVFLRTIVPQIRQYLAARVPDHLIPSHFVPLDQMPRTPAGKVDRARLPAPEQARPDLGVEYVAPTLPAEKTLASIWAEALHVQDVGIHDNYFELGGDSILGMQIVARAIAAGLDLTPRDLFEHQTIAELVSRSPARHRLEPEPERLPVTAVAPERFTLSKLSGDELVRLAGRLRSKRTDDDER
jgi:aryl carrier-like protein